ncbi:hypothetical protein FRC06_003924 [Ceratobasidium sp. 370]|nr:hypothetical protein FRC06_003924 [Ceratobasidium sp. 370]
MPPKGSQTVNLPEYVKRVNNDGDVQCLVCDSKPMKRRNLTKHLGSASHQDSLHVYEANKVSAAVNRLQQSVPVVLNPPLPNPPNPGSTAFDAMLSTTEYLDLNYIDTGDYSNARFSAGESEAPINLPSFWCSEPSTASHTTGTSEQFPPEEEEYFTPLPQRVLQTLAEEELHAEEIQERFQRFKRQSEWSPYETKIMFLLDLLDNCPRLRLSSEHLKLIIWVMKEAGCPNMPTFDWLRAMQKQLRKSTAITSHQYHSSQGNLFEMLDVPQLIGRDFSNPLLAPHIVRYPEDSGNQLSESWEALKWREQVPLEQLTPMYADGGKMYYVNELARLHDGTYVIPRRWITRGGALTADCWPVHWQANEETPGLQVSENIIHVPAKSFASNYFDITDNTADPSCYKFTAAFKEYEEKMPNPLRKLAGDSEELISCFIKPWCDDVSGGHTKQYQPHNNVYIMHGNLPGDLLNQEFCIRFASTATHASSTEQFEAIKQQLDLNNENPIRVYDAATARYVRLRIYILHVPADNRAQSEMASHCLVGGSYHVSESEEGYKAFFRPGVPRAAEETVRQIQEQITAAFMGVEQHVTDMQTSTGIKDQTAQTVIMELIKRGRELKKQLKKPGQQVEDQAVIEQQTAWLQSQPAAPFNSTNISGLEIDPIRASYVMRFKNNLIGRHFKMLMQLTAFQVHDLVSADLFALTKAVGDLGAVLYYSKITDLAQYLADLAILIDNVLDAFTKLDPARIVMKLKLHILTHLIEDILNHGPAVRFSTEVFECYNGVFRMCSVFSNHRAPSHDIAQKMIELDRFRHIASGGYWDTQDGPECASVEVRRFFETSLKLRSHLGYVQPKKIQTGEIKLHNVKKRQTLNWQETIASRAEIDDTFFKERAWHVGESVAADNGDICEVGSWVVVTHSEATIIGNIQEILMDSRSGTHGIVTIDRYEVAEARHPILGMPMLVQANAGACYTTVVASNAIAFAINVQHDCLTLRCPNSAVETIRQERINTILECQSVEHREDKIFIVNMHALHNARRVREVLPRHLTEPVRLQSEHDRQDFITAAAKQLHERQTARREEATRKRKAAREARDKEAQE